MGRLREQICVVTGASRGAGRAIAAVLGEEGATVYVTGRSSRAGATTDGLPGTVEDAAEEVSARGGRGIAVRCDHADDAQVQALFARVREERGKLDLLVNNAWGGYEGAGPLAPAPFWEADVGVWDRMYRSGVRAALVATRLAVPLMLPQKRGLVASTIAWSGGPFLGMVFYDLAKVAIARLMYGAAQEFRARKTGLAAVSLAPGFMRTERVMAAHAAQQFPLSGTESPEYLGRAVAALAADGDVLSKSGKLLEVGQLARDYGFTDVDGSQPPPFRIPKDASGEWWWKLYGGAEEWKVC